MKDMELRFTGNVPANYDRLMVPLIFRPYAEELARRARAFGPNRVLDTRTGKYYDALPSGDGQQIRP